MLNFGLGNNLEMKVKSKSDTITGTKKIILLESLNFSSSYNLALDSMRWSPVSISGRTTLFKILNINFTGILDPYAYDSSGTKLNLPEWKYTGKLGQISSANLSSGLYLTSEGFKSKKNTQPTVAGAEQAAIAAGLPSNYLQYYVDFKIPWSFSINYNLFYNREKYDTTQYKFIFKTTQSISFSGDINLTDKWKFSVSSGYDFESKKFTYTSVNIYRDLHCWEMRLSWIPFGLYKSYNFSINVKSTVLQDLKLNRRRNWTENF